MLHFLGGSGTLDLIPHGNPPVTDITWIADGKPLKKSPVDLRKDDLTTPNVKRQLKSMKDGLYQLDELLIFWDVKRSHMKNVTIRAKNDIGTNSQTFFLNVTCECMIFWWGCFDAGQSNSSKRLGWPQIW